MQLKEASRSEGHERSRRVKRESDSMRTRLKIIRTSLTEQAKPALYSLGRARL